MNKKANKAAVKFLIKLIKERRFCLPKKHENSLDVLDPEIFSEVIALNANFLAIYQSARLAAEREILEAERSLGITSPQIPDGKNLVDCNRFTGGFEISQVIPLCDFKKFIPYHTTTSLRDIAGFYYQQCLKGKDERYYTGEQLDEFRTKAWDFANKVQEQFRQLESEGSLDNRFVLILKTRFALTRADSKGDMVGGRLNGMQNRPHLMGYLLTHYSHQRRVVRHNYMVFSTSYFNPHVSMYHWSSGELFLDAEKTGAYDCEVYFATII